jgi:hypothetical protein
VIELNSVARVVLARLVSYRHFSRFFSSHRLLLKRLPSPPKYDLHAEAKIKGTIEEVKLPPKGSEKEIVHLLVKNGPDTIDVYLCPKSFFDDMGMGFSKGDEIALTGSKIKQGEVDLVLAREIVKGHDTFVLRDAKGDPVWN